MPELVRLYIRHTIFGFVLAGVFVAMLLSFNVANLWHLVSGSSSGILAGFLLFMFNGIVFSGVQFGIAIMRMADHGTDGGGKPQREPVLNHALIPIPVENDRKDRRG
ncbi:MAG: hypothetical protein WCD16_13760 [Paracoccaceae bacterium]